LGRGALPASRVGSEKAPLADGSIDVVLSNGVLNMVMDKGRALADLYRLLRPGGRLHLADLTLLENGTSRQDEDAATFFQ
jgi:ubiquinone/menaquinone biosynthesis C-methylase UbiE